MGSKVDACHRLGIELDAIGIGDGDAFAWGLGDHYVTAKEIELLATKMKNARESACMGQGLPIGMKIIVLRELAIFFRSLTEKAEIQLQQAMKEEMMMGKTNTSS